MLSFCHEMLSLKNLVSAIVTCTWRDFVGRTRMRERYARKKTKRKPDANVIESRYNGTRSIDSRRIRNLIHANRPRIRINSFHRPSAGLNFDRLSRLVSFVSPPPPTPFSLRSLQFSNDISLSIPLSRNLYPRPRRVNRTVSSYSVSSSGRRQPGRRVELVCLAVIPTVGGMHRVCRIIASPARAEPALISVSPLSRCFHLAFRRTEKFSIYRGRGNSIEIDK